MNTLEDFLADLKICGLFGLCLTAIAVLMLVCFGGSALVNVVWDAVKGALTW